MSVANELKFVFKTLGTTLGMVVVVCLCGVLVLFGLILLDGELSGKVPAARYYESLPNRDKALQATHEIRQACKSYLSHHGVAPTKFEDLLPYIPKAKQLTSGDIDSRANPIMDYKNWNLKGSARPESCSLISNSRVKWRQTIKCVQFSNGAVVLYYAEQPLSRFPNILIDPDGHYTGTPNSFSYFLDDTGGVVDAIELENNERFEFP